MSNEELSASQRAALAQQAAEDARRAAARHAAARRAEQDARRREIPARRPPALTTKAGIVYRSGATTIVDPARAAPPPTPPGGPATGTRPGPPATRPTPAAPPQPRTMVRRTSHPRPPAAHIAPLPQERPAAADTGAAPGDSALSDLLPGPGAPGGIPDRAGVDAALVTGATTSDHRPTLAEGERVGMVTGRPTSLPPLPAPPTAVIRTVAPTMHPDGLVLPTPPVSDATPPQGTGIAEAPVGELSLATVDIDVRPALHDVDAPAGDTTAVDAHEVDAHDVDAHDVDAHDVDTHDVDTHDVDTQDLSQAAAAGEALEVAEEALDAAAHALEDVEGTLGGTQADGTQTDETRTDGTQADGTQTDGAPSPWAPSSGTSAPEADRDAGPATADGTATPAADEAQTADLPDLKPTPEEPGTDRPWVRAYPPGVPDTYRYPLVPVTRFLDDAAQDFPDIPAVQFLGTDLSFRQLSEQVDRLAAALVELGLGPGERIAVALPWCPQLVTVLHAAWRTGMEPVVLDPDAGAGPLADAVHVADPSLLVVLDTLYPALSALRAEMGGVRHVIATGLLDGLPALRARVQAVRLKVPTAQIPQSDGVLPLRSVLDAAPPTATQADLPVETSTAVSLIQDGQLVPLSHFNLLAGAFQARLWIPDMRAGREVVAVAGSPADSFTLAAGLGLSMLAAGSLLLPEPRQGGVARAIDDGRPTVFVAPLEQVRRVLAPASKRRDLSSIRITLARGVAHDPAVRRAMEQRTGGRLRLALSAPAVAGMAVAQPVYAEPKEGSAGLPVSDCDIRVVDQDAAGVGPLEVRGPQVAGGGWVPLTLVGAVDELGDVGVVGPVGRVIRHAGGATDPEVLVTALRRLDGVADVSVHSEPVGTGVSLVVQVTVTDPTITESQLMTVVIETAPHQALPGRWLLTAPQPPAAEPPAESPAAEPAESQPTEPSPAAEPADEQTADDGPAAEEPATEDETGDVQPPVEGETPATEGDEGRTT